MEVVYHMSRVLWDAGSNELWKIIALRREDAGIVEELKKGLWNKRRRETHEIENEKLREKEFSRTSH